MFEPDADLDTTGSYSTADPNTLAIARTSTDHPIGVSLRLALPPAESRVCIHLPQGSKPSRLDNQVIAAHGDSVLVRASREGDYGKPKDYFVYNAGTTATDSPRPPSLSLLPPCYHYMYKDSTGILRRSENDLVVARLKIEARNNGDKTPKKDHVAEMLMFRSGEWWNIRWARIAGIENDELGRYLWSSSSVIPVGDNMLCWVCLGRGLIFFNVDDDDARLVYVPLPEDPRSAYSGRNVYPKDQELKNVYPGKHLLPNKVSYYLNPCPGGTSQINDIEPPLGILDKQEAYDASNSTLLQSGSAEPGYLRAVGVLLYKLVIGVRPYAQSSIRF
ncbi:hypothetical protein HU200_033134 [Digitaria exilis]|uniref:DUF1618 domain-containing protein n=1 Tax=Digitaria exilis TaxID=1010633 RepID=A0A835BMI3_9POAL|nr:hypothetical protein HU200_033134 [Digitaria exilis]